VIPCSAFPELPPLSILVLPVTKTFPAHDPPEQNRPFAFGDNWQAFAATIDERRVEVAEAALRELIGSDSIRGASLLDVGCGSGLHAVAALRLGATHVTAFDSDPVSVATTRSVIDQFGLAPKATVSTLSIFDARAEQLGLYDIVYSWGVLHHTGDLWRAMDCAAALVRPGGILAVALYQKTPFCRLWAHEKKFYAAARPWVQSSIRSGFLTLFSIGLLATGRSPRRYSRDYLQHRGMSFHHDVHDWLGGYPYQSTTPEEVEDFAAERGFVPVRRNLVPQRLGLFGTGCSEYVYRRQADRGRSIS
jgi:SAM-dependent methyltransferase